MTPIERFAANDQFARHVGVELLEIAAGRAKGKLNLRPEHYNGAGMVHGAVIFTLADFLFAVACNSHGTLAVAVNVSISFLKAAAGNALHAEAVEVSRNPKLATYAITVNDDRGGLVATFHGMAYRKKDPLPV